MITNKTKVGLLTAIGMLGLLLLTGCNKRCHCYGYDGSHTFYSPKEVKASGHSNCVDMIYQANTRYYSLCEWDY